MAPLQYEEFDVVSEAHASGGELERIMPPQRPSVRLRLKQLLTASSNSDWRSLAHAARTLGMTTRTLQRRLQEEGTTFRAVLDEVGLEGAKRVQATATTSRALAASLGFSEAAAFHRAFKRWTGTTPRKFEWPEPIPAVLEPREHAAGDSAPEQEPLIAGESEPKS
jgi:AraC-like DNA-binding protein